jgi:hypothetical protein
LCRLWRKETGKSAARKAIPAIIAAFALCIAAYFFYTALRYR